MNKSLIVLWSALLPLASASALEMPPGELGLSLGGANLQLGKNHQLIGIQNTFGNIHQSINNNKVVFTGGGSYLFNTFSSTNMNILLGASAYYLNDTNANGLILLERTFPNLSYGYEIRNIPLYATAKAAWHDTSKKLSLVADAGIGINFIKTKDYLEHSLDNGVTIPNQAFSNESEVKFSAMTGIGIRMNNLWKTASVEVGYKYFYLNEGKLNPRPQVINQLKTGNINAHALMITFIV